MDTLSSCAQLFQGPNNKIFTLKCCFLTWRRASKHVDCYRKIDAQNRRAKMFLEPGRNVFFEKVRNKKFRKIYISNTLLDYFSLKYKEDIFKRKTIGLCDFLKIKYFLSRVQPRARTAKLGQFFGNLKNLELKKVVINPPYCTSIGV